MDFDCLPRYILFRERGERPEEWVPKEKATPRRDQGVEDEYSEIHRVGEDVDSDVVDIFSIHSGNQQSNSLESLNPYTHI